MLALSIPTFLWGTEGPALFPLEDEEAWVHQSLWQRVFWVSVANVSPAKPPRVLRWDLEDGSENMHTPENKAWAAPSGGGRSHILLCFTINAEAALPQWHRAPDKIQSEAKGILKLLNVKDSPWIFICSTGLMMGVGWHLLWYFFRVPTYFTGC